MAKKREERPSEEAGGSYEFPMPNFDERAFMRREVEAARLTFVAVAIGLVAGVLARLLQHFGPDWRLGFLPLLIGLAVLRPLFQRLNASPDAIKLRGMLGNWSLVFFTGLALWVLLNNPPFSHYI